MSAQDCWLLHGSGDWSLDHAEDRSEQVMAGLLKEFWRVTALEPTDPTYLAAYRWRFALPLEPLEDRCLFDAASGLGACGDWCLGPRVEGAFLSGAAAAECILRATALGSTAKIDDAS